MLSSCGFTIVKKSKQLKPYNYVITLMAGKDSVLIKDAYGRTLAIIVEDTTHPMGRFFYNDND